MVFEGVRQIQTRVKKLRGKTAGVKYFFLSARERNCTLGQNVYSWLIRLVLGMNEVSARYPDTNYADWHESLGVTRFK